MAFTKQHYERVAKIARRHTILTQTTHGQRSAGDLMIPCDFIDDLADMFAADNPRFDRARFLLACGMDAADIGDAS